MRASGPVHLVDHQDDRQPGLQRLAQHEPGLRQRALAGVHQQQHPVHHGQAALHLAAEVRVPRRVHDVDGHPTVPHRGVLGQDRDALLPLQVARVEHALGDLRVGAERPGLPQHRVHQRGFAVVHVRDDRDVAQVIAGGERTCGGGRLAGGHAAVLTGSSVGRRGWRLNQSMREATADGPPSAGCARARPGPRAANPGPKAPPKAYRGEFCLVRALIAGKIGHPPDASPGALRRSSMVLGRPTALGKEEAMHPAFMESVAAERVKDMRSEAVASQRARMARRARRLRSALASTTVRHGTSHVRGAAGHTAARGATARHAG